MLLHVYLRVTPIFWTFLSSPLSHFEKKRRVNHPICQTVVPKWNIGQNIANHNCVAAPTMGWILAYIFSTTKAVMITSLFTCNSNRLSLEQSGVRTKDRISGAILSRAEHSPRWLRVLLRDLSRILLISGLKGSKQTFYEWPMPHGEQHFLHITLYSNVEVSHLALLIERMTWFFIYFLDNIVIFLTSLVLSISQQ
jgi:hypothetical protein